MNVHLMRHPAREGAPGRCIGQTDVALSAEGCASLPRLGRQAAEMRPTRVVSSDLQRCRLLAEEIAEGQKLKVELSPAWRELDFGAWEDRTWDDIQKEDSARLAAWMENYVEVAPPRGESFRQLQERALGALDRLDRRSGETVVVTTHAGVIRSLLCAFSDVTLTRIFEVSVPYGSLTHVRWNEGKWNLVSKLELTAHSVREDIR